MKKKKQGKPADITFPIAGEISSKLFIRAINQGRPEIQEFPHNVRPLQSNRRDDKIHGQ